MATKVKVEEFGKVRVKAWDLDNGVNLRVSGYTKNPEYGDYWSDDLTRVEIQLTLDETKDLIKALKKEAGLD